jgi:hypothetical protein
LLLLLPLFLLLLLLLLLLYSLPDTVLVLLQAPVFHNRRGQRASSGSQPARGEGRSGKRACGHRLCQVRC